MPGWEAELIVRLAAAAGASTNASASADVDVHRELGGHALGAGAGVVVRGGDVKGIAATVRGGLYRPELVPEDSTALAIVSMEQTVELSSLPDLSARRDVRRAAFDRTSTTASIDLISGTHDGLWSSLAPLELTVTHTAQDDRVRDDLDIRLSALRYCYAPGQDLKFCLSIFELQVEMFDSIPSVFGMAVSPLTIDHVALGDGWSLDAALGYGLATIDIPGAPIPPDDGDPDTTCEDHGTCVTMNGLAYRWAVRGPVGGTALELGARRALYPAITGEIAREHRAHGSVSWPIRRTDVTLAGFAAHTRWWRLDDMALAPGGAAITGGGDLTASYPVRDWTVDATLEVARGFYAGLDGGTPRAEVGAQGTLSFRHTLRVL